MSELEVKIVKLEPMRVASAYGFGPSPEGVAGEKIGEFARKKGLLGKSSRSFGFNNPNPSPGSPNYGYEAWRQVAPDVEPEGDIRIIQFEGGLYAVTQFKGLDNIGRIWKKLVEWREDSKYKCSNHQWLEELLTPADAPMDEYVFNLYLPIAE